MQDVHRGDKLHDIQYGDKLHDIQYAVRMGPSAPCCTLSDSSPAAQSFSMTTWCLDAQGSNTSIESPKRDMLNTGRLEPRLAKVPRDRLLRRCRKSSTATDEPKRAKACTDKPEPSRARLLRDEIQHGDR